jgi:exodeoxyribonuclease-1
MRAVRAAEPARLSDLANSFGDERLKNLLPLYKARNFPRSLDPAERAAWDEFCYKKLLFGGTKSRLATYLGHIEELMANKPSDQHKYLLEELRLYGESIAPSS